MNHLACFAVFSVLAFTVISAPLVTKYRDHRGFFGFKTVTQYNYPHATTLYCSGPGYTACKVFNGITVVGDEDEISLTDKDVENIENVIDRKIYSNIHKGTIVYADLVVVTFWYNEEKDGLSYTIYSKQQAKRSGIIY